MGLTVNSQSTLYANLYNFYGSSTYAEYKDQLAAIEEEYEIPAITSALDTLDDADDVNIFALTDVGAYASSLYELGSLATADILEAVSGLDMISLLDNSADASDLYELITAQLDTDIASLGSLLSEDAVESYNGSASQNLFSSLFDVLG